jgi:hypothetical protein
MQLNCMKNGCNGKGEYPLNLKLVKLLIDATVITLRHKYNPSEIMFARLHHN